MTTVLFWDIDGTLLTTGRAGIFAWEDAALEVTGRRVDLDKLPTAGLTDPKVGRRILEACEAPQDADTLRRLIALYEDRLPASLPKRQGRLQPGVREILEAVDGRDDVLSLLLTGNTRAGARAKLAYYGIDRFFEDGAFSDDDEDRAEIALTALERARVLAPGLLPTEAYVIGDTHHDILCGKAIGARTVAVATGPYSVADLAAHDPWWVVERLPAAGEFFAKVGVPARPASRVD
jgi:phosphoglycolate phosphatase-like HAD superfamily hydrolase